MWRSALTRGTKWKLWIQKIPAPSGLKVKKGTGVPLSIVHNPVGEPNLLCTMEICTGLADMKKALAVEGQV